MFAFPYKRALAQRMNLARPEREPQKIENINKR